MDNHSATARFLKAIFREHERHALFANLHPPAHTRDFTELDPERDCYWSIAAYAVDYVGTNTAEAALWVAALVIDDVGTKVPEGAVMMALGRPTTIVRTSAGNYQWGYRLSAPVAVNDWAGFFAGIEALVGTPLEARAAQTLMRLPMGRNTKPANAGFPVELVEINEDVEIDPDTIERVHAKITKGSRGGGGGDWSLAHLRALMALVPNTYERAGWIEIGHGLKALCRDDADGFKAFDEWSATHASYDAEATRKAWDSFGAGAGLLSQGGRLKALAESQHPSRFAAILFDDGAVPPSVPPRGAAQFTLGSNGEILKTMENAAIGLAGLGIACAYDAFHHRVHITRASTTERLTDHLVLLLRVEMNNEYGKDFGPVHIGDAIMALALLNTFNPVCDMLASAEAGWDGVRRLDRLGPDYFHTEDSELAAACFRKTMLAAVRRARRPGVKFDQILVLESPEGWDKSSAWEVLAGRENFSDADILGKDARAVQEELADVWIHEIADLSGLSRADVEHVKAFASRTNDRARGAYERYLKDQPRQSIEVGTTNSDSYLLSTTGNRRFWPFKLGARIDMVGLRRDRLQLWGEAARAESAGETLVLDRALWDVAAIEQEKRRAVDPWEDELANLVEMPAGAVAPVGCERIEIRNGEQFISNLSVHEYLAGYRRQVFHSGSGRKIAEIMKRLGWERCSARINGVMARGYKRSSPSVSVSPSVPTNPF